MITIVKQSINESKSIKESSLSRLISKIFNHDTGTITAHRKEYTHKQNQQRNKSLLSKLLSKGYYVTSVEGGFIEDFGEPNAEEVNEHVFFVEDFKDKNKLKENLIKLGIEFEQDSILFIPKANKKEIKDVKSYLIGTKDDINNYPGYLIEKEFPILKVGKDDYRFLTRVKNRPFYFSESIINDYYPSYSNKLPLLANKDWREIEL